MEKEVDLKVTVSPITGNLFYEWWCKGCKTYHYSRNCPFIEFYYSDLGNADDYISLT